MYKLMIVDNEQLIRQSLHHSIDWAAIGVEVVCEAANGYDAMRLAGLYRPDIVITDIRMPIMDGLEFAQNLRRVMPSVYIIMLSGYSDTAYLQRAIKIGINVYLMKTADSTPILQEVEHAKEVIAQQRASKQENIILQSILDNYLQSIISKFMQDLLTRHRSPQYLLTVGRQLSLPLEGPRYVLLARPANAHLAETELIDLRTALSDYHVIVAITQERLLCALINLPRFDEQTLAQISLCLTDFLRQSKTGFLVSEATDDLERLADQYAALIDALPVLFWNCAELLPITAVKKSAVHNDFLLQEHSLLDVMKSMDRELFEARLFAFIEAARTALIPVAELNASLARLEMASRTLWHRETGASALHTETTSGQEWVQRLKNLYPNEEESGLAENARLYIEQHFEQDLSLSVIASALFVSPSHLSRTFKQQYDIGVKQYINLCRIRQARKLMDSGERNMTVIAEQIGYRDYRRFAENFLKYAGVTLKEYRRSAQQGD